MFPQKAIISYGVFLCCFYNYNYIIQPHRRSLVQCSVSFFLTYCRDVGQIVESLFNFVVSVHVPSGFLAKTHCLNNSSVSFNWSIAYFRSIFKAQNGSFCTLVNSVDFVLVVAPRSAFAVAFFVQLPFRFCMGPMQFLLFCLLPRL